MGSDSNRAAVIEEVARFLEVQATSLVALPHLPEIVVGFDLETTDWEPQYGFMKMDNHLRAGRPCCENHKDQAGYICEVGFAIFRRKAGTREYISEEPVSKRIRLLDSVQISPKAFKVHGITAESCALGEDFDTAIAPILQELRNGAELVVHNLAHETYVSCREFQKRAPGDIAARNIFLDALYAGHCSSRVTKQNRGFHRKLSDEFSDVSQESQETSSCSFKEHCAGDDAAMCARVFSHHSQATVIGSTAVCSTGSAGADQSGSAAKRPRHSHH